MSFVPDGWRLVPEIAFLASATPLALVTMDASIESRDMAEVSPPGDDRDMLAEQDTIEATRMSFGAHLEELRGCLIRALAGVALVAVFTLVFGRQILEIIFRPLWRVQFANGLQPNLQALAPTDAFTAYLKISALSALILAMPWVLHQSWRFVASGLYTREKRFLRGMLWASSGLFIIGVLFLYFVVLPLVLQFFISFNRAFGPADPRPTAFQSLLLARDSGPPSDTQPVDAAQVAVRRADPADPRPGEFWVNSTTRRLMLQTDRGVFSVPLEAASASAAIQSQFAIGQYISFVLLLALAFGIAFETPIVVVFLAWSGLAPVETMSRSRRYVILGVVVASAVLTPSADLLNQLLLAGPMYVLFELGLAIARTLERRKTGT